jgi:hypothetical protein
MKNWWIGIFSLVLGCTSLQGATHDERTALYILETAKAFRTVYTNSVAEQTKRAGMAPKDDRAKDDHAIMLPIQFIKAAGSEIHNFDLGLIGLTPIYRSNLPKTPAEAEALKKLMSNPQQKLVTFSEGNQFKAISADFAIAQSCADCHNSHPSSTRRDYKQGDLMGAIIVRVAQ